MLRKNWLLFVILLSLSITGCSTFGGTHASYEVVIPNDVSKMDLGEDSLINEYLGIVQDIRWRLWANQVRFNCTLITEEDYLATKIKYTAFLRKYYLLLETLTESNKSI